MLRQHHRVPPHLRVGPLLAGGRRLGHRGPPRAVRERTHPGGAGAKQGNKVQPPPRLPLRHRLCPHRILPPPFLLHRPLLQRAAVVRTRGRQWGMNFEFKMHYFYCPLRLCIFLPLGKSIFFKIFGGGGECVCAFDARIGLRDCTGNGLSKGRRERDTLLHLVKGGRV